jgi:hypothetical protein
MSTTNQIKESEQKKEYPSPKNHQETEAKPKKLFSSNKICFQPGVPVMLTMEELLRRCDESFEYQGEIPQPHCLRCQRTGFVSEVPA